MSYQCLTLSASRNSSINEALGKNKQKKKAWKADREQIRKYIEDDDECLLLNVCVKFFSFFVFL